MATAKKFYILILAVILPLVKSHCTTFLENVINEVVNIPKLKEIEVCAIREIMKVLGKDIKFLLIIDDQKVINSSDSLFNDEFYFHLENRHFYALTIFQSFHNVSLAARHDQSVILLFQNCQSLEKVIVYGENFFKRKISYVLIVSAYFGDCQSIVTRISEKTIFREVSIMMKEPCGLFVAKTFVTDIDENTCKPISKIMLQNTTVFSKEFDPNTEPKDYKGCPLRVGFTKHEPFTFSPVMKVNDTANISKSEMSRGMEIDAVKELARHYNLTLITYYASQIVHEKNVSFPENSLFWALENGLLDLVGGGLTLYPEHPEFLRTEYFYIETYKWLVAYDDTSRNWIVLVRRITKFYVILIIYVLFSILKYCFERYESPEEINHNGITTCFLDAWGTLTNSSSMKGGKTSKEKILNLFYLVFVMHVSYILGVLTFHHLTVSKIIQSIETIDDLIKLGKRPVITPFMKNLTSDEKYRQYINNADLCTSSMDCYRTVLNDHEYVTILHSSMREYVFLNFSNGADVSPFYELKTRVTAMPILLFRNKKSLTTFTKSFFHKLIETGLVQALKEKYTYTPVKGKGQGTSVIRCEHGCVLKLKEISFVFYLLIIGCTVSLLAFLSEVVYSYVTRS